MSRTAKAAGTAMLTLVLLAPSCREEVGARRPERLVVAYSWALTSPEPLRAYEEVSMSILGNVYEALVDARPGQGLGPQLADSWHNPDDRTWVFRLRPGVRLHDGRLLEARHVVASLERARNDPSSSRRADLAPVVRIEARGAETVVVATREPVATLAARLSHVLISAEPLTPGGLPVGTGPYRVRSWTPGGATILEAFASHRDGPPPIAVVEFAVVPEERERVARLRRGSVDLVVDVSVADFVALSREPGLRTVAREGKRVLFLGMDTRRGPFKDVRMRRAAALALDRGALVSGPLGGLGIVASQLATPDLLGYDPTARPAAFDPERARALVSEAGHPRGFATRLDFIHGKYRGMDGIVKAIASQLAAIGIRVEPRPQSVPELAGRLMRMETPFFLAGVLNDLGDSAASYEYLLHTPRRGLGWLNGGDYSDRSIDGLLREARRLERPKERARILQRVAARVALGVPVIPLVVPADLYAFRQGLEFRPETSRRIRAVGLRWNGPQGRRAGLAWAR